MGRLTIRPTGAGPRVFTASTTVCAKVGSRTVGRATSRTAVTEREDVGKVEREAPHRSAEAHRAPVVMPLREAPALMAFAIARLNRRPWLPLCLSTPTRFGAFAGPHASGERSVLTRSRTPSMQAILDRSRNRRLLSVATGVGPELRGRRLVGQRRPYAGCAGGVWGHGPDTRVHRARLRERKTPRPPSCGAYGCAVLAIQSGNLRQGESDDTH